MGATNSRVKVYRVPSGIRVQCCPNGIEKVEQTSKSKCFMVVCGEFQFPVSERFLRENFRTVDGRAPETERYIYDRIYTVYPATETALVLLSDGVNDTKGRTYTM